MDLIYSPHPFLPTAGRKHFTEPVLPDESLAEYLIRLHIPIAQRPLDIIYNGHSVDAEQMMQICPGGGDHISVQAIVQDTGGEGGSDAKRTILTIAVLVLAAYTGGAAGVAAFGQTGAAVASAAVGVGGLYLVDTIAPISIDTGAQAGQEQNHDIAGGRNPTRRGEPLTLIFGKVRHYPDFGANDYISHEGDERVLNQTFNFGLSDLVITNRKIGDNLISIYVDDLTVEESGVDGALTSFPGNVDTAAGGGTIVADRTQPWTEVTSSAGSTRLTVDITGQLHKVAGDPAGEIGTHLVFLEIQYRPTGSTTWVPFFDVDNRPPGWSEDYLPRGYDYSSLPTYFDINSLPAGFDTEAWPPGTFAFLPWIDPDGLARIFGGGTRAVNKSFGRNVPEGQYDVRVRWAADNQGNNDPHKRKHVTAVNLFWSALRSDQPDTANYTGQKREGLHAQAGSKISGNIDSYNADSSARFEVWTGTDWVLQETSNPAWHFRKFAMGYYIDGRLVAGAGMALSRIDEDAIKAWGAWCDLKNLTCNFEWRRASNRDELFEVIARTGRARPTWQTGKLGVIYDQANQPKVSVFGMSNIFLNTFKVEYITEKLADEIVLEFKNEETDFGDDTVSAIVPGVTNPQSTATIKTIGITNRDQAGREANLQAARQVYHRKRVTWESDLEGFEAGQGDVIELSHDLTKWGYSGRLLAGTTTVLQLDRDVYLDPADTNYIAIREPNGTDKAHEIESPPTAGDYSSVTLLTPLKKAPDGNRPVNYQYRIGPSPTPGKLLKVVDVKPVSDRRVRLIGVPEVPEYYLHEDDDYIYVPPKPYVGREPVVRNVQITEQLKNADGTTKVNIAWSLVNAEQTLVRVESIDGLLDFSGTSDLKYYTGAFEQGQVLNISLVPVPLVKIRGLEPIPHSEQYTVLGLEGAPSDVQNLTSSIDSLGVHLRWDYISDLDRSGYEIRVGVDWDSGALVDTVSKNEFPLGFLPAGTYNYMVKSKDRSGVLAETEASLTVVVDPPNALIPTYEIEGEDIVLTWPEALSTLPLVEYEIRYGSDYASSTFRARTRSTTITLRAVFGDTRRFWVVATDAGVNDSIPGFVDVDLVAPGQPTITPNVIDNNVLLRYQASPGTLPIVAYEIRRGTDFATAEVLQAGDATFATFFETSAGTFTYWVVPIDSAENYGLEKSTAVRVSEPPDYQLINDYFSDFSTGTKTGCLVKADGHLLAPVDIDDTYAQHFTNNGYSSPQEQIDAGFSRFIQPSVSTGDYEEEIDYGSVLPSATISLILNTFVVIGNVTINTVISTRKLATDPWDDNVDVNQVFAADFQFVKIRLDFTAAGGDDLVEVSTFEVKLDAKLISDRGRLQVNAGDVNGTPVTFNRSFIDVETITVSAKGTQSRNAIYDFEDAPNPTGFDAYLFDKDGVRVSGEFSWTAEGY